MADDFRLDDLRWVMSMSELRELAAAIRRAESVVVDLETTGLDDHATRGRGGNGGESARVVLAAFTLPEKRNDGVRALTYLLPLSHPSSPWRFSWRSIFRSVAKVLYTEQKPLINHNMKFDARWVHSTTGYNLAKFIVWDTIVSSHVLDENTSSFKLKEVVPHLFGIERWDDFELKTPAAAERVDMIQLGEYAARDTYWTWRLYLNHRMRMFMDGDDIPTCPEEWDDARLGTVMRHIGVPTVKTLTEMEQRGLRLDQEFVREWLREAEKTRASLEEELVTRYEPEVPAEGYSFAPTSKWWKAWTAAAVKAGDLRVAEMTPNGAPKWDKAVLTRQARAGKDAAEKVLALRDAIKELEFLRSWLTRVSDDGRIHATFRAGHVVTGRLSSADPNLQQVKRSMKGAFIPSEGHYIAELDYSQVELRVGAFISRCEPMLAAFNRGDDLHRLLAARIAGKDPADVTKAERQAGKSANFGLLYGMGATGFQTYAETAYDVYFSSEEAEAVRATFFEMWDGLAAWHSRVIRQVQDQGQVVSPLGRVRRLPGIWSRNSKTRGEAERAAINSPVQGMASDLMQMAAASIEGYLIGHAPVKGARLVGTVHDSILVEVPVNCWREVGEECRSRMQGITGHVKERLGVDMDVPLVADLTVGTRWGAGDILAE